MNIPTNPKGETPNNARRVLGLVASKAGVGEIDSKIGANDTDTRTDGMINNKNPLASGTFSKACAAIMPSICTIIYSDKACPRWSLVTELFNQLSAVT